MYNKKNRVRFTQHKEIQEDLLDRKPDSEIRPKMLTMLVPTPFAGSQIPA